MCQICATHISFVVDRMPIRHYCGKLPTTRVLVSIKEIKPFFFFFFFWWMNSYQPYTLNVGAGTCQ